MSNSNFVPDNELNLNERELGERIRAATSYQLPAHLASRIEREIAAGLPASPRPIATRLVRPLALAAILTLLVGAITTLFLLTNEPTAVSAAEISRRVTEASLRNVRANSIVHRVYAVNSSFQGVAVTGTHEEWAQVDAKGNITHYKVVQDELYAGKPNRTLILFLKADNSYQFWSEYTNAVYSQTVSNYVPHLNPLENSTNLVGATQTSQNGSSRIINSKVEIKDDVYIVSFYSEYLDSAQKATYGRNEFYVNKKTYAVTKVTAIPMLGPTGPDGTGRYEASLQSTEILPAETNQSATIFVLGAPQK